MGFMHGIRTVHHRPLGYASDADGVSTGRLDDTTDRGLKSVPVRKLSQHLELPRCSVAPQPWNDWGAMWRPQLDVVRNSPLLCDSGAEDVFQLQIHLTHLIGRGREQGI
jgi:hypothetical protein